MRTLSVPVYYDYDGHEALVKEAYRTCVSGGVETFAGLILRRLADRLASVETADRQEGFAALRLLGIGEKVEEAENPSFASKLAAFREQSTFTVEELAKRAGISRHAIYAYEQGKRRPTWAAVQALANALGISTDTFRDS